MTGRIEVHAADLRVEISGLRESVRTLSSELASAWIRIAELETRLHDHEQAVPHAEAAS
jgi:chromosome segregation ATPase